MTIPWIFAGVVYAAGAMASAFLLGTTYERQSTRDRLQWWHVVGTLAVTFLLWWVFLAILAAAGFVDLVNDLRKRRA